MGRPGAPLRGPDDEGAPGAPGRRWPGGGGIGRPVGLIGRGPGGGGIGRPDGLIGCAGRSAASPSAAGRCEGRIVVGLSVAAGRGAGAGLAGAAERVRTVLGSLVGTSAAAGAGAGAASTTGATSATGAGVGAAAGATGASATGAGATGVSSTVAGSAAFLVVRPLALVGSSGATSRRSPSASTRRRIRSACASSIEADAPLTPTPNLSATASNSLLVRPSSLESSCTRIFFIAKTFPNLGVR